MLLQILNGLMETDGMDQDPGQSLACTDAGDLNLPSLTAPAVPNLVGDGFHVIFGVEGDACLDWNAEAYLVIKIAVIIPIPPFLCFSSELTCKTHGDVRLVGGQSPGEGLLEICIYGVWRVPCGTASCSRSHNTNLARVACKQLGYSGKCNMTSMIIIIWVMLSNVYIWHTWCRDFAIPWWPLCPSYNLPSAI